MSSLYEQFDIVVVPFPFTDKTATKRRPALILSDSSLFNAPIGHSVMAMVTTATHSAWPLDASIEDLDAAGLTTPSIVRMKLFTLDHSLIVKRVGALSDRDANVVRETLRRLFQSSKL